MTWQVEFHPAFAREAEAFAPEVRAELLALSRALEERGPRLGRPSADTLNGSRHANMKEGRFRAGGGAWRVAFAFDPERRAVLLVAGDKSGVAARRFYEGLIARADSRYDDHLARLREHRR